MKGCEGWQRRVLPQPVGDDVPNRDAFPLLDMRVWICKQLGGYRGLSSIPFQTLSKSLSENTTDSGLFCMVLYFNTLLYLYSTVPKSNPSFIHSFIHSDIEVGFKHPLNLFISPKGRHADWLKPKIPGKVTFTFSFLAAASLSPGCAFVAICSLTTGASSSSLSRIWRLRLQTFLTGESASWTPFCTFRGLFAGLELKKRVQGRGN